MQATAIKSVNAQLAADRNEPTSSFRALHNTFLSELPGVAFAVLTLLYVVSSLVRL